ncbi:MAG: extracellular solute-binding protein [Chloroflexota bacterium]|nr:extracellular solute-binding protein [Chloroflexota bacterium]
MVEQFQALQPGIRVLPRVTSWADHRLGLDTALAGGPGPDLFYEAAGSFRVYGIRGAFQPIDSYVTLDGWRRFSELPREQATMSGLALFYPFLLNGTGLLVNRQLFREADAEDAIPTEGDRTWTFAEFQDAAAELGAFLSSSENQQYVTATRSFPVRGALVEPYADPILAFMQEGTKFAATDPLKPSYFAIGNDVADLVDEVLTGDPNANSSPAIDAAAELGQQAVDSHWDALGI